MAGVMDDRLDGFILPDGEFVSLQDTDKIFSMLTNSYDDQREITGCLWGIAQECVEKEYHRAAFGYLEKILSLVDDLAQRANCLLKMALMMEQAEDYHAALKLYFRAFELPPPSDAVWYFLHNNTAYCLNKIGQYQEAERYCRTAIGIDSTRHNAHKNLGIALQHQGQHVDAARSYMRATVLCPTDSRALDHLKELIANHQEIMSEVPDLLDVLHEHYSQGQRNSGVSHPQ